MDVIRCNIKCEHENYIKHMFLMLIIENNLLRNLELIESIENGLKIEINLLKSRNNLINTQTGKTK